MKIVTILKGLPASGKSTWAREQVLLKPGSVKRVNKDELRQMIDAGYWSKGNEQFVIDQRNSIIWNALLNGKHVIVDDTNLEKKHEEVIRDIAKKFSAQVIINDSFLSVPVEECIARDALRGDKSVGEKVIRDMAERYLKPVETVSSEKVVMDKMLPECIIVDIDGTIAKFNGRGPFDYDKVHTDDPHENVIEIIGALCENGFDVIVCSGRPHRCRVETAKWLRKHNIDYKALFMRADGDDRNDAVVKREFLDDIVKNYYVRAVFDDRDRVVKAWRDAGLTCFQCDYGDF